MMLFLSLFSFFWHPSPSFVVETEMVEEVVVTSCGDYRVVMGEWLDLRIHQVTIKQFSRDVTIQMLSYRDQVHVLVIDGHCLSLYSINSHHEVILEKTYANTYHSEMKALVIGDHIVVIGGILTYQDPLFIAAKRQDLSLMDAFLMYINEEYQIEQVHLFGGYGNEYFKDVIYHDTCFYIQGVKDGVSGGDFGNGGIHSETSFIAKMDETLNVVQYEVFRESHVLSMHIIHQHLLIACHDAIYRFDLNLICKNDIYFSLTFRYARFAFEDKVVFIDDTSIYLVDAISFDFLLNESLPIEQCDIQDSHQQLFIYTSNRVWTCNIYDLRLFHWTTNDIRNNTTVQSIFGAIDLTHYLIAPTFNPQVYGSYQVTYSFNTMQVEGILYIEQEANVSEGEIYPIGYALSFTGIGYLNDVLIVNNHVITIIGSYELTLYGCNGEETTICFRIDKSQMAIDELSNKHWDKQISINESFTIDIQMNDDFDYTIESVIINQEEYREFTYANQTIRITLYEDVVGLKTYHVEKIRFIVDDGFAEIICNQLFRVLVLPQSASIGAFIDETSQSIRYYTQIESGHNQIRGVRIRAVGHNEITSLWTLSEQSLFIHGLTPSHPYEIIVSLWVNEGGYPYERELFTLMVVPTESNYCVGHIRITQKSIYVEAFDILIPKDQMSFTLRYGQQNIFYYHHTSMIPTFLFSIGISVIISGLIFWIRKRGIKLKGHK